MLKINNIYEECPNFLQPHGTQCSYFKIYFLNIRTIHDWKYIDTQYKNFPLKYVTDEIWHSAEIDYHKTCYKPENTKMSEYKRLMCSDNG